MNCDRWRALARGSAQADRVEESLRSYTVVIAQTWAPLDRQEIEPVIVEELVCICIASMRSPFFDDMQKASP
jgi:hypothetical protein